MTNVHACATSYIHRTSVIVRNASELAAVRKQAKYTQASLHHTHSSHCSWISESINRSRLDFISEVGVVFLPFPVSRLKKPPFPAPFQLQSALNNKMPWLLVAHVRTSLGMRLGSSRMAVGLLIVSKNLGNEVPQGIIKNLVMDPNIDNIIGLLFFQSYSNALLLQTDWHEVIKQYNYCLATRSLISKLHNFSLKDLKKQRGIASSQRQKVSETRRLPENFPVLCVVTHVCREQANIKVVSFYYFAVSLLPEL